MDGDVRLEALLVLAQELGHGPDLGLRLREGPAVSVVARVGRSALLWWGEEQGGGEREERIWSEAQVDGMVPNQSDTTTARM